MSQKNDQVTFVAFCKDFRDYSPLILVEWKSGYRWVVAYKKGRGIILKETEIQLEETPYGNIFPSIPDALRAVYDASRQDKNFVEAFPSLEEAMNFLINLNQLNEDFIKVPDTVDALRLNGKVYGLFCRDDTPKFQWEWCRILVHSSLVLVYCTWDTLDRAFPPHGKEEAWNWGMSQAGIFQI